MPSLHTDTKNMSNTEPSLQSDWVSLASASRDHLHALMKLMAAGESFTAFHLPPGQPRDMLLVQDTVYPPQPPTLRVQDEIGAFVTVDMEQLEKVKDYLIPSAASEEYVRARGMVRNRLVRGPAQRVVDAINAVAHNPYKPAVGDLVKYGPSPIDPDRLEFKACVVLALIEPEQQLRLARLRSDEDRRDVIVAIADRDGDLTISTLAAAQLQKIGTLAGNGIEFDPAAFAQAVKRLAILDELMSE